MSFDNSNIFTTPTQNPCLMDSDIPSLEDAPSENLHDSWIPKEFTSATMEGVGFSEGKGKITFIPVQVVADKTVSIDAYAHYWAKFSGPIGGFGQTDHTVSIKGLCGDGQYVFLKSVNIMCGTDDQGNGVMACLIPSADGRIKSNEVKFRTINMDESSATQQRTFNVYITATVEIANTNFGLGQLFPKTA